MSVWVIGYTEAKINGKWHCIDFYQYGTDGTLHHVPCIEGQSRKHHSPVCSIQCDVHDLTTETVLKHGMKRVACAIRFRILAEISGVEAKNDRPLTTELDLHVISVCKQDTYL